MDKIKVEMDVAVSEQDIDDIMATAMEGGINYWCDRAKVVGDYLGEYSSEQIARGGKLRLHMEEPFDDEETEWYELDKEKFLKGLNMYIKDPDKPYEILYFDCDMDGYLSIDTCQVDATVADMIVQYALFGEVVFG